MAKPTEAAISIQGIHHDHGRGPVLKGLDLDVPRGAKVAIMGSSGAGKSTLLSLLRGTLPIQQGAIVLDGQDLGAITPEQACQLSASVAQATWLFSGTVADNLRMAKPEASEEELWTALRRAHVAEEVRRMPRGLDSDVGERGQLISGAVSEAAIIDALKEIGPNWTVLVVTHRHSLLAVADSAHQLRDGVLLPLETAGTR